MAIVISSSKENKMQLISSIWVPASQTAASFSPSYNAKVSKEQHLDKMKNKKQEKDVGEMSCRYNRLWEMFTSVMTAKEQFKFN